MRLVLSILSLQAKDIREYCSSLTIELEDTGHTYEQMDAG